MITALTAVSPVLEAQVATRLEGLTGVRLVRRCPDVADLVATGAAHLAQVAVVSADLAGLGREVLGALERDDVLVVGVFSGGDQEAQRRLRQWGLTRLVAAEAPAADWQIAIGSGQPQASSPEPSPAQPPSRPSPLGAEFEAAIHRELGKQPDDVATASGQAADRSAAPGWLPTAPVGVGTSPGAEAAAVAQVGAESPHTGPGPAEDEAPEPGTVVAIWGPIGSPGRTSLAVNLAAELAQAGRPTIIVDADTYGASLAQTLGLLDEAPGLAAATRLADLGDLDLPRLAAVAPEAMPGVRVLTGVPRADRWAEIGQDSFLEVLRVCRLLAPVTIIDTGFCLEEDEELSYDTRAPRRNGVSTSAIREADEVIVVGSGDPVGLQRLVRGLDEISTLVSDPRVVVNRVRNSAVGAGAPTRVRETLHRFAGVEDIVIIPDDREAFDAAMLAGHTLRESAAGSAARAEIVALAGALLGAPITPVRGERRRLRLGRRERRTVAG